MPASLRPNDLCAGASRANKALKTSLGSCGESRPVDSSSHWSGTISATGRSGVNAAVTTLEQPTVDTSDVAAVMYSRLANNLRRHGRPTHILGRSYDLTSAYRQLCVFKKSSKFANMAVYCPNENRTFVLSNCACLLVRVRQSMGSSVARGAFNGMRCDA